MHRLSNDIQRLEETGQGGEATISYSRNYSRPSHRCTISGNWRAEVSSNNCVLVGLLVVQ
jgi:hypothetical protein